MRARPAWRTVRKGWRSTKRASGIRADNHRKIAPVSECNEQLRHHKHGSKQQMRWIVHQSRLATFKDAMSDDLNGYTQGDQNGANDPHAGSTRMIDDHHRGREQGNRSGQDGGSNTGVEQQPVDQHRDDNQRRSGDIPTKCVNGPQAQWQNRSQKQEHDTNDVHRAISSITVIINVVGKLALEIRTHVTLASWIGVLDQSIARKLDAELRVNGASARSK